MDAREQRGLVIAALCKLNHADGAWLVPSQTGAERIYRCFASVETGSAAYFGTSSFTFTFPGR